MGSDSVHSCWQCSLRFASRGELMDHLAADHTTILDDDLPPADRRQGLVTVAVDPAGPASPALAVAIALARQTTFAVGLVAAPAPGLPTASYLVARQREVTAGGGRTVPARMLAGPPADAIVALAADGPTTLLCLATSAHGTSPGSERYSVSADIVGRSPVPVLLVGPAVPAVDPASATPLRRLVVVVDGSEPARRALEVAAELGERIGADLDLVEVVAHAPAADGTELRDAVASLATPPRSQETLRGGDAARALADHAGTADDTLIVVGADRGTAHGHATLGEVVLGLARHATCPVLVVPLGSTSFPPRTSAPRGPLQTTP